ncbi:MAG: hypothetical protein FWB80_09095 [Defluviitaleaceae bacterium]|nr:hypothetical protein [Defluviitaleaceae bacterium]
MYKVGSASINYLKKMAFEGNAQAQARFELGRRFEFGEDGANKNIKQAVVWYKKASEFSKLISYKNMLFSAKKGAALLFY